MRFRRRAMLVALAVGLLLPQAAAASMTIVEAVGLALEQDSGLRQAEISLRLAELGLAETMSTFALPTLSFQLQPPGITARGIAGVISGSLSGSLPLPLGSSATLSGDLNLVWDVESASWESSGWSLGYTQRLDLAQQNSAIDQIERAQEAVEDAQAAVERTRNEVIQETIATYSSCLSGAAELAQSEENLRQAQQRLNTDEELAAEGLRGSADLAQAQIDALDAEIKVNVLRTAYEQAIDSFARGVLGADGELVLAEFEIALEPLRADARLLLAWSDVVVDAVGTASSVVSATEAVEDAKKSVGASLREVLPNLSISAGYSNDGWTLSGTVTFDFFSPGRDDRIEIARASLAMAEAKLAEARNDTLNRLLSLQASLRSAADDLDRLALEEERWALEQGVMETKYEAGSIAEADWIDFLESFATFELETRERGVSLLLAYLSYREALGFDLDWEDWLS